MHLILSAPECNALLQYCYHEMALMYLKHVCQLNKKENLLLLSPKSSQIVSSKCFSLKCPFHSYERVPEPCFHLCFTLSLSAHSKNLHP